VKDIVSAGKKGALFTSERVIVIVPVPDKPLSGSLLVTWTSRVYICFVKKFKRVSGPDETLISPVDGIIKKALATLPLRIVYVSGKPVESVAVTVPTLAFVIAFSAIVNDDDVTTGGLLEATMRTHTLDNAEIPAPDKSVTTTSMQKTRPFVNKVASFLATLTAPETLSTEKTGLTEPNVLFDAEEAEIVYRSTSW